MIYFIQMGIDGPIRRGKGRNMKTSQEEIAEKITGSPVTVVDNNGAPTGEKHFLFYNPPVVNQELGLRNSVVKEVRKIVKQFLPTGIQLIVFARSRLNVKILVTYLNESAKN